MIKLRSDGDNESFQSVIERPLENLQRFELLNKPKFKSTPSRFDLSGLISKEKTISITSQIEIPSNETWDNISVMTRLRENNGMKIKSIQVQGINFNCSTEQPNDTTLVLQLEACKPTVLDEPIYYAKVTATLILSKQKAVPSENVVAFGIFSNSGTVIRLKRFKTTHEFYFVDATTEKGTFYKIMIQRPTFVGFCQILKSTWAQEHPIQPRLNSGEPTF